jgi:hypothetical protein
MNEEVRLDNLSRYVFDPESKAMYGPRGKELKLCRGSYALTNDEGVVVRHSKDQLFSIFSKVPLLDTKKAADLLGINHGTLKSWAHKYLPKCGTGHDRIFLPKDVLKIAEQRREKPSSALLDLVRQENLWASKNTASTVPSPEPTVPLVRHFSNTVTTHETQKRRILTRIFYQDSQQWDGIVIMGAQYREDVRDLLHIGQEHRLPIYCYDASQGELDKLIHEFGHNNIHYIPTDLSTPTAMALISQHLYAAGLRKPFIYENLSGHHARSRALQEVLKIFPSVVFFTVIRAGTEKRLRENFLVTARYQIDSYNVISVLELGTLMRKSGVKRGSRTGRALRCQRCGANPSRISINKAGKHRCTACKFEWNTSLQVETEQTTKHLQTT